LRLCGIPHVEQRVERVRIHYLPKYAPDTNPVEEVWWRLHNAVTRNHRCRSMQELLDLTMRWLDEWRYCRVDRRLYNSPSISGTVGPVWLYLGVPVERFAEGVEDPAGDGAGPAEGRPRRARKGTVP
jgi:hypothetical protein